MSTQSPAAVPAPSGPAKIRLRHLQQAKEQGRPFAMLTAYDQFSATVFEEAGIETLLVGDSVGTTVLGHSSTTSTTHADMLTFTAAVARSVHRPLVVADLAFGTYETGPRDAVLHGIELVRAGAEAVKLEGGAPLVPQISALVEAGTPVFGHLGFTPQSVNAHSGHRVQGRDEEAAERLLADALAIQEAGASAIVLELVPARVAAEVTAAAGGARCRGQGPPWRGGVDGGGGRQWGGGADAGNEERSRLRGRSTSEPMEEKGGG